jgi:DNA/RNA endonuclease YhcR with UshA esterase domain
MKRAAMVVASLLWAAIAYAQTQISASEAKKHVGERATVCGRVASARYAMKSSGSATFINLDRAYPNQIFTIVIWGSDRQKFGDPETSFSGKRVCVSGEITLYRGAAETTVHEPSQITIQ